MGLFGKTIHHPDFPLKVNGGFVQLRVEIVMEFSLLARDHDQ
jgi:hypothetical protein